MEIIKGHRKKHILSMKILLVVTLLGILVAGGLITHFLLTTTSVTATPLLPKIESTIVTSQPEIEAARAIVQQDMQAGVQGQYGPLWTSLHPTMQALWPNQQAFIKFWQGRFQDYTMKGFTLNRATPLASWVNPETMAQYTNVIEVDVSLQLEPKSALLHMAQLPPEMLNPSQLFQHLSVVLQHSANNWDTWQVLAGGPFDLEAPILPPTQPVTHTVQVPIPMFHHISDALATDPLAKSLAITPTLFSQQMDYLKAQGYHTITFNQMFNALYYDGPLPKKPIILTFDDSYSDAYKFAYPILKAHGFSGMFYIISGKIGWQGQMNWPQMREMLANGMQMGSHTVHHVDMGTVMQDSLVQAQQELQVSQITLEHGFGIPIQQFCYPSGEPFRHGTLAQRQQIISLLAQDGYIGATTDPGVTGITQQSADPFVLLRIRVDGRSSLLVFEQSMPW